MKRLAGSVVPVVVTMAMVVGATACGGGSTARRAGELKAQGGVTVDGRHPTMSVELRAGDEVRVTDGSATVKLPGGGLLTLRAGGAVRFTAGPQLEAGDLLVQAAPDAPVAVGTAVGVVTVAGVARLRRDLALEVGTYQGTASVAADRTVVIPQFAEDTLPAAGLVPNPTPLVVSAADAWDRQFLGVALDLTSELNGQSRFVSANTPAAAGRTAAFYRSTVPGLAATPAFTEALLADALPQVGGPPAPGDALVAAAIALAGPGPFASRWSEAFALRQQGAQWGIVALEEKADPRQLISLVGDAVAHATLWPPPAVVPVHLTTRGTEPVPARPVPASVTSVSGGPTGSAHGQAGAVAPNPGLASSPTPGRPPTTSPPSHGPSTGRPQGDILAPVLDPLLAIVHGLLPGHTS